MKLIIAGSRNGKFGPETATLLDKFVKAHNVTLIIEGGQKGIDACAGEYAARKGIDHITFHANWVGRGKPAGPFRNRRMAKWADALLIFPGDIGTKSMKRIAEDEGLEIFDSETVGEDYD